MKTDISKTLNSGKLLLVLLLFATSIACNQQQPEDTKEVAEDRNDEKFENNPDIPARTPKTKQL